RLFGGWMAQVTNPPKKFQPAQPYLPSFGNVNGQAPVQLQGKSYNGQSSVVPPYMGNPNKTQTATRSTLGDYSPQASGGPPPPPRGGGIPATQPTLSASNTITPSPSRT